MHGTSDKQPPHVPEGMPPLVLQGRPTSFFEFWPAWVMYFPVALQWLLLSVRYRSLSLPLIANPAIPLSGMVGVAKTEVFDAAGETARQWILPWITYTVSEISEREQAEIIAPRLADSDLRFPLVVKPNIGCRGAGVKLLKAQAELEACLASYPAAAELQFQQLSQWEAEAGIFYVRFPGEKRGRITSLALKYTPFVTGDGQRTLGELVAADPRAGQLLHLYRRRHSQSWESVIARGEPYRPVFSASHSKGAVFRNAPDLISQPLSEALDAIFADIQGMHYGRLDVKFRDVDYLRAGSDFEIIEINGASSESIQIWDWDASLWEAVRALLQQYLTLFKLGPGSRHLGHRPPGLSVLYSAWRHESNLVKQYPDND